MDKPQKISRGMNPGGSDQEKLAIEAGKIFGVPVINSRHEVLNEHEEESKL